MKHALLKAAINTTLALVVALLPHLASAQQIEGKLFTSPEERAYLDYLRNDFLARSQVSGFDIDVPEIPDIPVETAEQTPQGPIEFSFGGIMTSRDGSRSVWLNSKLLKENELPSGIKIVVRGKDLALSLTTDTSTVLIRPGQTVNLTTGEIQEGYERRQTEAPATPPAATPQAVTALPETDNQNDDSFTPAVKTDEEPATTDILNLKAITDNLSTLNPSDLGEYIDELQDLKEQLDETP